MSNVLQHFMKNLDSKRTRNFQQRKLVRWCGKFIQEKQIIDAQTTSGALISFSLESAEAVKQFGETAKANGGNCYRVDMGIPEEQMYGLEVQDLDGNSLEPVWMKM